MSKDPSRVGPVFGFAERFLETGLIDGDYGTRSRGWFSTRRAKIRLLMVLTLIALAILAGAYYGLRYQQRRHAEAFLREALQAEEAGRLDDAVNHTEGCLTLAPDAVEVYLLQAKLLRKIGQLQAADQCLVRMLAANPRSAYAYALRGRYFLECGRIGEAEEDLVMALEVAPNDRGAILFAVDYWFCRQRFDASRTYAERLQTLYPSDPLACGRLAGVEASCGNRAGAIAAMQRGLKIDRKNTKLLYALVEWLCTEGRIEDAETALRNADHPDHDQTLLKLLHARIAYAHGQWRMAAQEFTAVRPQIAVRKAFLRQLDFWLGDCYGQMGNRRQQIAHWRTAVASNPDWSPLRWQIIETLSSCGQIDEALDEARHIGKHGPASTDDQLLLAHLLIAKARQMPAPQRQWKEIETVLQSVRPVPSQIVPTALLQAQLLLLQNRPAKATGVLQAAQAGTPKSIELWLALAGVAEQQDDATEAFRCLDQAELDCGSTLQLLIARAAYLLWHLGPDAASAINKLADQIPQAHATDRTALAAALAVALYHAGDHAHAERLCASLISGGRSPTAIWLLQLQLAFRSGRMVDVKHRVQEIEEAAGRTAHWYYGQAAYFTLMVKGGHRPSAQPAQEYLIRAQQLAPTWPCVPLLGAELDRLVHREAAAHYVQAVELGESCPVVVRQVLDYLLSRRRYLDVQRVLQKLAQTPPRLLLSPHLGQLQVLLPPDDLAQARRAAEQTATKSQQVCDHLWRAQVCEVLGLQARAEGRTAQAQSLLVSAETGLAKAEELDHANPGVWMSRLLFLLHANRTDRARQHVATARKALPASHLTCCLAQSYELLGDPAETEQHWKQALNATDTSDTGEQAVEYFVRTGKESHLRTYLEDIVARQQSASPAAATWARRKLALIYSHGNAEDALKALQLVDQNLAGPAPSPDDQRLKTALLVSRSRTGSRQEVLGLLESTLATDWLYSPDAKFALAKLCQAEKDYPRARKHLVDLIQYYPEEPRYLAELIRVLLDGKEFPLAESLIRRLRTLAPHDFLTVMAEAELLFCQERFAAIPPLFHQYVAQCDPRADDPTLLQDHPATALEALGDRLRAAEKGTEAKQFAAEAESLRLTTLKRQPDAACGLALRLARQEKLEEALQWMGQALPHATLDKLADTIVQLLLATRVSAQREQIEKFLLECLKRTKRSPEFLVVAAFAHTLRRQFDEAEQLFRESLQKDPVRVPALNNLALQLALQNRQLDEALELIQKAIQTAGPLPSLLDTRAVVYGARSEPAKALHDLEQAITAAPNPLFYFHKALILSAMKDQPGALQADAKARQLGLKSELLHPLEQQLSSVTRSLPHTTMDRPVKTP